MRDWWLRALLVLQRPRPVFVALRDESINAQFTLANPNPYDPRFNRGLSDFDVPHNFRLTGIYDLPRLAGSNVGAQATM